MRFGYFWQKTGKVVYAIFGIAALLSLVLVLYDLIFGVSFSLNGLIGELDFLILIVAGLDLGIKLTKGRDFFGN